MPYIPFESKSEEINISLNHINVQVFHLLEDLEAAGQTSSPRGLVTREANLATLDIDPLYPIMNFEPRKFNWRYFAGELAWYLRGETSIDFINNFSSFWKDICPSGHANSNYGTLILKDHPSTIYAKTAEGEPKLRVNQLEWVFNSLAKDQHSRQAVAFFNTPYFQYEGNKDFVCTMYINFWIRKNYLDMKVQMRSNDIFFGLTYDAPWFSTIHQSMYLNLKEIYPDLKLGIYYHCADNIHYYERHFEIADKILSSNLQDSIQLKLMTPIFRFEKWDDNYKIVINEEAVTFLKIVEDTVRDGTDVPKDQDYWRSTLNYLYEITGDIPVNF
jgi:thymidylate synthase